MARHSFVCRSSVTSFSIQPLFTSALLFSSLFISFFASTSACQEPLALVVSSHSGELQERALTYHYDVVIYGGTAAGLFAAVQCVRMNKTVAIVTPESTIGGLTSSGLGWTDSKNGNAIGGIAREFYQRIYTHYLLASAWVAETRQGYLNRRVSAQPGAAIDTSKKVQWTFEPKVAESTFEDWMKTAKIPIYRNESIVRSVGGVKKNGTIIQSFTTQSGKIFAGSMFIDAGYEGDLMAAANVSFWVGRDSRTAYNESLAGVMVVNNTVYAGIDPFVRKGNSSSGLLPGIEQVLPNPLPASFNGLSDGLRMQTFNYRLCLTKAVSNQVAFPKPSNYNEADFELLIRYHEAGNTGLFTIDPMPNNKTDSNSSGYVSFDFVGGNFNYTTSTTYSEANYVDRATIIQKHKYYQQGTLWTLANHPRIPVSTRNATAQWGLAKDEFTKNSNWPYQLYVREARRMKGNYTLTQQNVQAPTNFTHDTIAGMGSYSIDSHVVRRIVSNKTIYDEGRFYVFDSTPYPIPYGSLIPLRTEATNFINPVTVSASHVAFGSVRMEPTYMILGQTAATAAIMAIQQKVAVQDIDRSLLTARLKADKQVLSF
jgi:hypothetical protein